MKQMKIRGFSPEYFAYDDNEVLKNVILQGAGLREADIKSLLLSVEKVTSVK